MKNHKFILFGILLIILSCDFQSGRTYTPETSISSKISRDSWQKPDLIIEKLGDISNKTVVDIGAGTGYFTFRLAFSAKKVIAIDIDKNMLELIELFRENLPDDLKAKIETRIVSPEDPGLLNDEANTAVIINTIGYIEDKLGYFTKLKEKLTNDGTIVIVDYKNKFLDIDAPPLAERIDPQVLKSTLEKVGFMDIEIDQEALAYQYIVIAKKTI